jgi:hypothetical protein
VFECQVRHQACSPAGCASANLFSFELTGGADLFFAYERLQRTIHGASQYFGGRAANNRLNNAVYGGAIVDVTAHEGGVDRLGRHEDGFEVDALFAVETLVIGNVERQKTDVGRLDPHSDLLHDCLRMNISIRDEDEKD